MSYSISKTELKKFSLFSIGSEKYGYGHYNRINNLISILKVKGGKFSHYSYGENYKNKNNFLNKIKFEFNSGNNIILDFSNDLFLNKSTTLKIKKIFNKKKISSIYIIDSPTKKNLSSILNLDYTKTLIPFEVTDDVKRELSKIKKKKIGMQYFIYSNKVLKKKKIYDIVLSFGGSDNYKGSMYVLKLLRSLKIKKNIVVVIGKYFKDNYKKEILSFCEKNKFKSMFFSRNFSDILNKSRLLITNSGLTKYEGFMHGLSILVFSDSKESEKIDKIFINKTKQFHFSYLKNLQNDTLRLKKNLNKQFNLKLFDKNIIRSNIKKIQNFFEND